MGTKSIKQLRLAKGCTQKEVATRLNIDRSTYSTWENEKIDFTLSQLKKIANEFDIEISALIKMLEEGQYAGFDIDPEE